MGASDQTQASCLLAQPAVLDVPHRPAYVAGKGQEAENFTERGTASIQMEATAEEVSWPDFLQHLSGYSTPVSALSHSDCDLASCEGRSVTVTMAGKISPTTVSGRVGRPLDKVTMLVACSPQGCKEARNWHCRHSVLARRGRCQCS